jgi:energy-coupling factor transporter ATP-binding protein EcfA2
MQPEVLVVDEPTTGLDWKGSKAIMDLLSELNQGGHTIVFITHDMRIVTLYAKRVIVMGNGQMVADTRDSNIQSIMTDDNILRQGRLRPLQVTRIARKLADLGVNPRILSSDDLCSDILDKTGGQSYACNI